MSLFTAGGHLRGEALLLLHDGELDATDRRRVERHLQECPLCLERLAFSRVAELQVRFAQEPLPPAAAARERLQAELSAAAADRQPSPAGLLVWLTTHLRLLSQPAPLLRIGTVLALLVVAVTFRQVTRPLQELMGAYEDTGPEPNHTLTPGSALPLSIAEVCQRTDDDLDPPVSPERQRAVFQAYRMSERTAKAYQVDYLINPQLGGDSSLQNLWPEPYHATVWNATAKDALETRLHGLVCSGQLGLQTAQQELAGDWIAAYKKYFHTARPVRTVTTVARSDQR